MDEVQRMNVVNGHLCIFPVKRITGNTAMKKDQPSASLWLMVGFLSCVFWESDAHSSYL